MNRHSSITNTSCSFSWTFVLFTDQTRIGIVSKNRKTRPHINVGTHSRVPIQMKNYLLTVSYRSHHFGLNFSFWTRGMHFSSKNKPPPQAWNCRLCKIRIAYTAYRASSIDRIAIQAFDANWWNFLSFSRDNAINEALASRLLVKWNRFVQCQSIWWYPIEIFQN